jgi:elongation factor Ts
MGVLVALTAANAELGKDLAMQIAAMNPVAVDAESVPAETVERERAIIIDTMKEDPKMAGKPEDMIAKIAEGKIGAFFKEQTLLAQAFVKDGSKSVGEYIKSVDGTIKVTEFKRVALG